LSTSNLVENEEPGNTLYTDRTGRKTLKEKKPLSRNGYRGGERVREKRHEMKSIGQAGGEARIYSYSNGRDDIRRAPTLANG
jgi:hypothetical protein